MVNAILFLSHAETKTGCLYIRPSTLFSHVKELAPLIFGQGEPIAPVWPHEV